jgi:hypothetical protein
MQPSQNIAKLQRKNFKIQSSLPIHGLAIRGRGFDYLNSTLVEPHILLIK